MDFSPFFLNFCYILAFLDVSCHLEHFSKKILPKKTFFGLHCFGISTHLMHVPPKNSHAECGTCLLIYACASTLTSTLVLAQTFHFSFSKYHSMISVENLSRASINRASTRRRAQKSQKKENFFTKKKEKGGGFFFPKSRIFSPKNLEDFGPKVGNRRQICHQNRKKKVEA